jgi:ABC-type nitrate/sulfonate/bicarbonate transport system substrate-binding protein
MDAVLNNSLTETNGPMADDLDVGLVLFAPNQPHVDYELVSASDTHLSQLKGQNIAVTAPGDITQYLNGIVLGRSSISLKQVTITYTGTSSSSIEAAVKGIVNAAWVHSTQVVSLPNEGRNLHVLAVGSKVAPFLADSYLAANGPWLKANPAYAEAIDLAWIKGANIFANSESQWVKYAQQYTDNVGTVASTKAAWLGEHQVSAWTVANGAEFTAAALGQNYQAIKAQGEISGRGNRPQSAWLDLTAWNAAIAVYESHKRAYGG